MMKKPWREAATLIVIARDATKNRKFDYKVLTFKRTEKTSFMPNSICFPGGAMDPTDEERAWTSFFKNHKIPSEELRRAAGIKQPFIFDTPEGKLEREYSLRLTAIRETFEELGVVICRDPSDPSTSPFSSYIHTKDCDIPVWQKKIHSHEESLHSFCEKFQVVPDIMNIYEWSCWLTPTFFRPKRFETVFFLVALNSLPPVYPESHEVQEFQWDSPDDILRLYDEKKLWLPPPQFTEIRRLSTIKSIDKLVEIAKGRVGKTMELVMPMQYKTKDGLLHCLPGDDLYPEHPNYHESDHDIDQYADKTMEEMRAMAKNLCRSEQRDMFDVKFFTNVIPRDGHISFE